MDTTRWTLRIYYEGAGCFYFLNMADSNGSGRGYLYQRSVKDPFSESFEGFSRGEYNAKADGRKVYMNLANLSVLSG